MEAGHTATPWHCKQLIGVTERGFALFSTKESGATKTTHRLDHNGEFSEADAEFIVRACNSFDDLVGALRFILAFYEPGQTYLDTNAWKQAEAGARSALSAAGA